MAWIRLDDQIAHHPKLLKAGPSASWFWVCCIAYCQKFLTDGYVSDRALATLCPGISNIKKTVARLIQCRLLDRADKGVQVHDYLEFNESKVAATARRKDQHDQKVKAGRMGANSRWQKDSSLLLADDSRGIAHGNSPIPSVAVPSLNSNNKLARSAGVSTTSNGGNGNKRPIYQSDRFVVFDWQMEKLSRLLGPHFELFDLHGFFNQLSLDSRERGLVIPQRDNGEWLMQQVLAEAKRRRLPIASATETESLATMSEGVKAILKKREAL